MTADTPAPSAGRPAVGPTFFGEPRALAYLAFTEAWERFSYYGMTALLVLYMSQQLLLPGHVEHVAGFAAFRAGLEGVFGRMSTLALASQIYGLYTAFIYFTPVLGGLIADRGLGRRNAVVLGALLMSGGHIAMAFDRSFLLALVLLISGCGLLKGNISSQVGALYREDDGEGRTRGFAIFSMGINVGAIAGPLACGLLAQLYGWHVGFALAGGLMLIGLATYLAGYRHVADSALEERAPAKVAPLSAGDWKVVAGLMAAAAITVFQSVAYYQNSNIGLVWIDHDVDLTLGGFHVPVAWFSSVDPVASVVAVPFLFALWRWQAKRGVEPGDLGKIGIGAWMAAAANLILVLGSLGGGRVSMLVPLAAFFILGVAFLYYWPTLLALVSRAAPPRIKATLMGAVFLSLFVSNALVGWVGGFYERLGPTAFWALHVVIGAAGGGLILLLQRPLGRILATR